MTNDPNPLCVEVTRGDMLESRHIVHAAICDADGETLHSWGDIAQDIYPRSSIKPLQAIPLVASGAAEAFNIEPRRIALACASHIGEPQHVDTVRQWLPQIGCSVDDLECGAHPPRDETSLIDVIKSGEPITRAFNNCSGKHSGFLTTAKHLGEPTKGYIGNDHPVQQRLADLLANLGGSDLSRTARGIDGCGIPVLGMPLDALARAMARMAAPETMEKDEGNAADVITKAMAAHPEMVRGTNGFDTRAMTAGKGRLACKTGAEGVHIAIVPEKRIGIALKVADGNGRASDVALTALLDYVGVLDDTALAQLADVLVTPVTNAADDFAGEIRMADGWRG